MYKNSKIALVRNIIAVVAAVVLISCQTLDVCAASAYYYASFYPTMYDNLYYGSSSNIPHVVVSGSDVSGSLVVPFYFYSSTSSFTSGYYTGSTFSLYVSLYMPSGSFPSNITPVMSVSSDSLYAIRFYNAASISTGSAPSWYSNPSGTSFVRYNFYAEITLDTLFVYGSYTEPLYLNFSGFSDGFNLVEMRASAASSSAPYVSVNSDLYLGRSIPGQLGEIDDSIDDINDTLNDQFQRDEDDANQAGDDASGFASDLKDIENKWAILWYPIKFSNELLSVFTSGSASQSYRRAYYNVTGYTYDDSSGCLVPVINPIATYADSGSSGAVITFPEYTLPVLDVKLWDSYTFDLSTIKDSFPAVFDAIYVVSTVIEVYWFVGFLRDKYDEVFGG